MLGIGLGLTSPAALWGGTAVAPGVPWTPTNLGASLVAWWNADDHGTALMTDDGAGLISAWKDRVTSLNIAATTTARPTWAATSFNSAYAGVTFDGAGTSMFTVSYTALPTGAVAGEIWALASNAWTGATGGNHVLIRYGGLTSGTARALQRIAVSSVNRFAANDGGTGLTDTVIDLSGPHIMGGNWSGTTQGARIDGRDTTPATATIVTLATNAATRLRLGSSNGASPGVAPWNGPIRHVIVTLLLSGTEREKLEGWFAWNAGLTSVLPGAHPYKSVAPTV